MLSSLARHDDEDVLIIGVRTAGFCGGAAGHEIKITWTRSPINGMGIRDRPTVGEDGNLIARKAL